MQLVANQVYPLRGDGDRGPAMLDSGNGQNNELSAILPGRTEPCVMTFDDPLRSFATTTNGDIVVAFANRRGVMTFASGECR